MKFQSKYVKSYPPVTMEDIKNNSSLRKFYNIIRISRILRIAMGIALIILIFEVGV